MKKKVRALLKEILEIKDRKDDFDERKFLMLVDQTFDCMDLNIAKTLMKTFLEKQDYGTQERVISAILRGGREIYIQVILEELPRLKKEAKNWIDILLCPEIEHYPHTLEKIARTMPKDIKNILREFLSNNEILSEYPNASNIVV